MSAEAELRPVPADRREPTDAADQLGAGGPRRAGRDPAPGAVAGHPDRRRGQPGAGHRRRGQGRRPPGVLGQPGHDHDRALVRPPGPGGPGRGQAARLAGLPRDPVPARPAGPQVPDHAPAARRPAVVPEPDQGPGPGRLLHRLGRAGRGRAAVRRRGPPVRRRALRAAPAHPLDRADRGRRAGRGQRLGGGRRPGHPRARRRHLDRRLQPAVAGPGGAGGADRRVAPVLRGVRLARAGGQVRRAGCGSSSPGPAGTRCAAGSTGCRTSSTSRCSGCPPARSGTASWTARRPRSASLLADVPDRRAGRAGHRPGRARPGLGAAGAGRAATRWPTGPAWSSRTR